MAYFDSDNSRILSKKASKQLATLLIMTFVNSFIISPAFAADEVVINKEPIPPFARERVVIKAPESKVEVNAQLIAAEKDVPDERPEFAKKFKILPPSERIQAGKLSKDKPLFFTNDAAPSNGIKVTMTAYNSERAQTDNSPCTTANGFNVCEHGIEDTVAANFLPMGTVIMVPELFGNRKFVVRDRTNTKYATRVDFWMKNRQNALQFGKRHASIVVVKPEPKVLKLAKPITPPKTEIEA